MDWHDVTRDWQQSSARLRARFPHIDPKALHDAPPRAEQLARHIADRHDLTLFEAKDEMENALSGEDLRYRKGRRQG